MATLNIYERYEKKLNSTKFPSTADATVNYDNFVMKEPTSFINPVFIVDISSTVNPRPNYWTYVRAYNRCYFVTDIIAVTGQIMEIHCHVDVLGTYSAYIKEQTCYVERSADSSVYSTAIYDAYVGKKNQVLTHKFTKSDLGDYWKPSSGVYLLTTVSGGHGTPTSLGTTTYALTASMMAEVLDFMLTEGNFADTFTDGITKTFFNPFQYITGCIWLPLAYDKTYGLSTENVSFGWWTTDVEAKVIGTDGVEFSFTLERPTPTYTDFRAYASDWTQNFVYLPSVGIVPLPNDYGSLASDLVVKYYVSYTDGATYITLPDIGLAYSGSCGVQVAISQNMTDVKSVVSSGIGAVSSAFTGNVVSSGLQAFDAITTALQPNPSTNGSAGSRRALQGNTEAIWHVYQFTATDFPLTECGKPTYHSHKLGNLSGYCKCLNASPTIPCTEVELQEITNYLNGGFYLE